uniref:Uncharacterized protein n=1 Tax=Arundo donax TaxID=35708 RepID=A0A0A9EGW9_ARUDO
MAAAERTRRRRWRRSGGVARMGMMETVRAAPLPRPRAAIGSKDDAAALVVEATMLCCSLLRA